MCYKQNMVIGDSDLMIWDSNIMWKKAERKKFYVIIYQEYVREAPAATLASLDTPLEFHLQSGLTKHYILQF